MEADDPLNPSFTPSLPQCSIRQKVPSSGYATGQVAPQPKRDVERTWEVPTPFRPELPDDELRAKVPSSGYGKVLITPTKKEPVVEQLSFKPELPKNELREKVPGSAYGKVIPKIEKKEAPPAGPFKPQLPPNPLREKAASSAYGKVTARPKTAPAKTTGNDFTLDGVALANQSIYTPPKGRYELLKEHTIQEQDFSRARSQSPIRTRGGTANSLRARAQSNAYGRVTASLPVHPKPEEPPQPHYVTKTPLADKVSSSGYGTVPPPQGVKHTPPPPPPLWSPVKRTLDILPEPTIVQPKAYKHIPGTGYGTFSPPKAERQQKPETPKWTPNSAKVTLGEAPKPKSKLYNHVPSSGYGSTYVPAGIGRDHQERYTDVEEGDYEENAEGHTEE